MNTLAEAIDFAAEALGAEFVSEWCKYQGIRKSLSYYVRHVYREEGIPPTKEDVEKADLTDLAEAWAETEGLGWETREALAAYYEEWGHFPERGTFEESYMGEYDDEETFLSSLIRQDIAVPAGMQLRFKNPRDVMMDYFHHDGHFFRVL